MLIPILSAVSESFATILDKFNLNIKRINGRLFTTLLLIFMALFSLPLLFFFQTKANAFTFYPLLVLALIIIGSAVQNVLFYIGLANRNLSSLEPIRNSEPILVILLAFLFFPLERNLLVLILGIIATLALIYSHMEKSELRRLRLVFGRRKPRLVFGRRLRLVFDRYTLIVFSSMFVSAFLGIGYKYILTYYTPLSLYVIRAIGVALILVLLFKPKFSSVTNKQTLLFIVAALLYSAAAILQLFAIAQLGLSISILVLTLSPVIIYLFSRVLLKERLTINRVISSTIIIACIILASIYL